MKAATFSITVIGLLCPWPLFSPGVITAGGEATDNDSVQIHSPFPPDTLQDAGHQQQHRGLLQVISKGGIPNELGLCQGDCDYDTDCKGSLICYKRTNFQSIPGCAGGELEESRTDFCIEDPNARLFATDNVNNNSDQNQDDGGGSEIDNVDRNSDQNGGGGSESDNDNNRTKNTNRSGSDFGSNGLCVIGCTPYIDWDNDEDSRRKYLALIEDVVTDCDIIVHVGDTKASGEKCNESTMTRAIHSLEDVGKRHNKLVLYTPGDNEISDCHRHASKNNNPNNSRFVYKAQDARNVLIDALKLKDGTDLTGQYIVETHFKRGQIPGSNDRYSCDFDKYYETQDYAIATIEVLGGQWYLKDERKKGYPYQDTIDPLDNRLQLYINAKDCALEWITQSAEKASASGLRAVFLLFHGTFYDMATGRYPINNNGVGDYYGGNNLRNSVAGIKDPYQPLFDHIKAVAYSHPDLMFYVVHSDGHRSNTMRLFPDETNYVSSDGSNQVTRGHQNVMVHQIEGSSRGLTMYTKFTVDSNSFQPVTLKEEWSEAAYMTNPKGHTYQAY